jgi:type I restriction enzyme, S subunit
MASEWRSSTWGKEISLEYGKALRGYDKTAGLYRVFGSNGPIGWTSEALASGPGVILGRKGAYRGVHFSPKPFFVIDTAYYVLPKAKLDMRWLYYAIKHHKIGEIDDGSPIPSTTRAAVYMLDLDIPPHEEQRAIARILGTLDDKIDLNRRMNETLEAMARAIFKSWFVDFDPVRAKTEKRSSVFDLQTATLFPHTFQDSRRGKIPLGWEIDTIKGRASAIQYGLTESASGEAIGPRFLRITDIQGGRVNWSQVPYCRVSNNGIEKYRIFDGDIFVARTGASTGENIYVVDPPEAVFASYLVRFRFTDGGIARVVGEFMRTPDYFEFVQGCIGGSAQPNASAQTLASAEFAFPPAKIAGVFYKNVRPMDQQRAMNARQSVTLAEIRDALLPMLLSGEIRVKDAEKVVESIV